MAVVNMRREAPSAASRQPPPDRTAGPRAVLAEKIAELNRTLTEIAAMEQATSAGVIGWSALEAAHQRVADAQANLEEAKERAQRNLIRSALGETPEPGADPKAAASELRDAQDALAGLREARSTIEARKHAASQSLVYKKSAVEDAANLVLRAHIAPDIDRLIAQINEIYILAGEKSNLLEFLIGRAVETQGPAAPLRIIEAECRFTSIPNTWAENQRDHSVLRGRWTAAYEALKKDHTAPLPEGFEP